MKIYRILILLFSIALFASPAHANPEGGLFHDRIGVLVFQLGVIIFSAWGGGRLFQRMKLPDVLGEIIAGLLIGPYVLGQIAVPGFPSGVFPLGTGFPISSELYALATIASVILLFLTGLETDFESLMRYSFRGGVIGAFGLVVSFSAGALAAMVFGPVFLGRTFLLSDPIVLFMGIISTATSVGLTARILSQNRKLNSSEGVTILTAAVIDDVLGIILLAVILGMIAHDGFSLKETAWISFRALAIWLGFSALGIIFSSYIARFLKKAGDIKISAVLGLAMALILAAVFEKSGLALIIGAYVMGLSISKTDLNFVIQEQLEVLTKFFVPVFFCVMGMLIDVNILFDVKVQIFALCYFVLAFFGKFIGCGLPAYFLNFNLRGATIIGIGMVPRGEVAFILAGIGLSMGIIGQAIFNVAVIMTFLTVLIPPLILDVLLKSDKPVLKTEEKPVRARQWMSYKMPNPEISSMMLNRVCMAFDEEGFYIYKTRLPERTFHMRRNDNYIILKAHPDCLMFNCEEKDSAFIHTLFYEVIAELRLIAQNVQIVAEHGLVVKPPASKEGYMPDKNQMNLHEILSPLAVSVKLHAVNKAGVIQELVSLLGRSGQLSAENQSKVIKEIEERENVSSTGLEEGVALPHVKTYEVKALTLAFGLHHEGVNFGSIDGKPSKIFILALGPRDNPAAYLGCISEITKFLISPENRKKILTAKTDPELYDVLMNML